MNSYAFFFNSSTFQKYRVAIKAGFTETITYVGFADARPFNRFQPGDELFIVGLHNRRVHIAGRMVISANPLSREQAVNQSGRNDLMRDAELICFAAPGTEDIFRPDLTIPPQAARGLELFTSDNKPTNTSSLRADAPDPNLFRACPRLSTESADLIRNLLGIRPNPVPEQDDSVTNDDHLGVDDDEYRLKSIKSRRGQHPFRLNLLEAYGGQCVITRCAVPELLEAAHIKPHSEMTDYRVSNGLLFRADMHTLFDLDLIGFGERCQVVVSPLLKNSEYWRYNGQDIGKLPVKSCDQPNMDSLKARLSKLKR
jgi:hypothetical protein